MNEERTKCDIVDKQKFKQLLPKHRAVPAISWCEARELGHKITTNFEATLSQKMIIVKLLKTLFSPFVSVGDCIFNVMVNFFLLYFDMFVPF